jgi:hypothetical protein
VINNVALNLSNAQFVPFSTVLDVSTTYNPMMSALKHRSLQTVPSLQSPYYVDHDIEVAFEHVFTADDLILVNKLRFILSNLLSRPRDKTRDAKVSNAEKTIVFFVAVAAAITL